MRRTRIASLALATLVSVATLAPVAASATNGGHGDGRHDKGRFLPPPPPKPPKPPKAKPLDINALPNAPFELRGRVASIDAAARTLVVQVHSTNLPGVRGTDIKVGLGSPSFIARNGLPAAFADIMFNDQVTANGVKDPTSGTPVAYIVHTEGVKTTPVPTTTPPPPPPPITTTVPAPVPAPPPITSTITSTISAAKVGRIAAIVTTAKAKSAVMQLTAKRAAANAAKKAAKRAAKKAAKRAAKKTKKAAAKAKR